MRLILTACLLLANLVHAQPVSGTTTVSPNSISLPSIPVRDAKRLFLMKEGQTSSIILPVLGQQRVTLHHLTQGADATRYWHGTLNQHPGSAFMLRQRGGTVTGTITLSSTHYRISQPVSSQQIQLQRGELPIDRNTPQVMTPKSTGKASTNRGSWPVLFNMSSLQALPSSAEVRLSLPTGEALVLLHGKITTDNLGVTNWTAYSRDDGPGYDTIISQKGNYITGTIRTRSQTFQITTRQGETLLTDTQAAGLMPAPFQEDGRAPPTKQTGPIKAHDGISICTTLNCSVGIQSWQPSGFPCLRGSCISGNLQTWKATRIDVLIAFDPALGGGSTSDLIPAQATISNSITAANQAFTNSRIKTWLNVVHTESITTYPDNDNDTALEDLPPATTNSAFSSLTSLRITHHADLVIYMRPYTALPTGATTTNSCGVAWLLGQGSRGTAGVSQDKDYAYSVVSNGTSPNPNNPNLQYTCDNLVLAHEVGHLLGSAHDKAHSNGTGAFPYSYGYGFDGAFGTIMSYLHPQVAIFSNPSLNYCGAPLEPCGNSQANNTLSINQTSPYVAIFY